MQIATRFANLTKSEDGGLGLRGISLELLLLSVGLGGVNFCELSCVSEEEDSLEDGSEM